MMRQKIVTRQTIEIVRMNQKSVMSQKIAMRQKIVMRQKSVTSQALGMVMMSQKFVASMDNVRKDAVPPSPRRAW